MVRIRTFIFYISVILICGFFSGCAPKHVAVPEEVERPAEDLSWTERVVTEEELIAMADKDPDLSVSACWEILGRLNIRSMHNIASDVKKKRKIKVPNNFSAYKNWTPMPIYIPELKKAPKFILVIKDIPFLGWYEKGRLAGDGQVCIGKKPEWTKIGRYKVLDKDIDHISMSYRNAFGRPAAMPYALKIYGNVWIHGGDITDGFSSHGCINLPLGTAEALFNWADVGTGVMVVGSLSALDKSLDGKSGSAARSK